MTVWRNESPEVPLDGPSELEEAVLLLLERAGLPTAINDKIAKLIEEGERSISEGEVTMTEVRLVSCSNGHRSTVPVDAIETDTASAFTCPTCGLGVARKNLDTEEKPHSFKTIDQISAKDPPGTPFHRPWGDSTS